MNRTVTESKTKEVVLDFIEALNREDFKTARMLASEDMKFIGVLGTRDGAEAYFHDMERMRLKYDIKKLFADEDDVCLFFDLQISGQTIFCCGWYHLSNDKIKSVRVIFDPRPILESANRK